MNKVNLIGRLTAKPELRYTSSNISFSRFAIAVNRPKQKDKEQETDFIDCVVWRGQAKNLTKYQDKGSLVAIEGSLRKENYTNKDGDKRYNTYVLVDRIEFLSSKNNNVQSEQIEEANAQEENDPFADFGQQVSIDENWLD